MKNLSLEWTKHLKTPEDKEEFIKSLASSKTPLLRLRDILQEWRNEILTKEITDDFQGDWAYQQAFRNGEKKVIYKLLNLLNIF